MGLLTILEIIATLSGLIHVYLLTKEKIIAWPFGIVTVGTYIYIFFVSKLYSEAILHVVYLILNIYGWYNWSRRHDNVPDVPITRLSVRGMVLFAAIILAGTVLWGGFMKRNTDASFPYVDAYTTVASLCAQYLLARKKIDNWILWILVDLVAIPMYLLKDLFITSGLYFIYLLLCIHGWLQWRKSLGWAKVL